MGSNAPSSSSSPPPGAVSAAPIPNGCCIRVRGRGTVRESAAARDVATGTLEADPASVAVFDLSECEYLDSTFLGCLTGLFQAYGRSKPPRFMVSAPPEVMKKLMGACRLDKLLPAVDPPPPAAGAFVPVPAYDDTDRIEVAKHVMACHRALAAIDSPMRAAFTRIADQLERELATAATAGSAK